MPNSAHSSPGSAPCRLEWRPSRWQAAAQVLFALLMPWAATATALPAAAQWPLGLLAGASAALQAWRYARRPPCDIVIPVGEGAAQVDGQPVDALALHDRGPLLQLSWRLHGRRQARLFWPDTLTLAARRELRLAVQARPIPCSRP
jgi:toxin CptA